MTLEELHGFLFGLAILPEMIKPSEWLPIAFGEEMLEFEKQDDVNLLMGHLFSLYNRLNAENQKGTLVFPCEIASLHAGDVQRMGDWAHGLSEAMALMPEIWHWDESEEDEEDLSEDEQDLVAACGIVLGIADPDNIPELFDKDTLDPKENKSDMELQATLFALLPRAVLTIQEHTRAMVEMRRKLSPFSTPAQSSTPAKAGRNEPCPCGSGKKYVTAAASRWPSPSPQTSSSACAASPAEDPGAPVTSQARVPPPTPRSLRRRGTRDPRPPQRRSQGNSVCVMCRRMHPASGAGHE